MSSYVHLAPENSGLLFEPGRSSMNKQSFFRANGVGLVLATGAFMLLGCDNSGRGLLHLDARPSPQWTCDKQFTPVLNTLTSGFSTEEFRMVDNVSDWCQIWDTLYASYFTGAAVRHHSRRLRTRSGTAGGDGVTQQRGLH